MQVSIKSCPTRFNLNERNIMHEEIIKEPENGEIVNEVVQVPDSGEIKCINCGHIYIGIDTCEICDTYPCPDCSPINRNWHDTGMWVCLACADTGRATQHVLDKLRDAELEVTELRGKQYEINSIIKILNSSVSVGQIRVHELCYGLGQIEAIVERKNHE